MGMFSMNDIANAGIAIVNNLQPADANHLGGIKVGENLSVEKDGTLHATPYLVVKDGMLCMRVKEEV